MCVNRDVFPSLMEMERVWFAREQIVDKFFEKKASLR